MTHVALVKVAAARLAGKPFHPSHGRSLFVLTEYRTTWGGESPDVIGWASDGRSVVLECKTSRADFLADRRKKHVGMGMWRYYVCLPGVATVRDLPAGCGLVVATGRGCRIEALATRRDGYDCDGERRLLLNASRLTPADIPAQLKPGARITDPARFIERLLSDLAPTASPGIVAPAIERLEAVTGQANAPDSPSDG